MSVTVTTQVELDTALTANESTIYIESPEGVWITVGDSGSSHVVAWGSSHVVAWGSSHVVARGSSHVVARGSSHVEAWGSSHVVAWDSSHVEARGSSHVVAWGSSHVEAWGSSHVEARGSSHVVARGSSHVVAWGSSHVEAWGSSHVEARPLVAVHLHSATAEVEGGVIIDIASLDLSDPQVWTEIQGVDVEDGHAVVYKAVDDTLNSGRGFAYPVGETVEAPDWKPTDACGAGLHFGPTPRHARDYNDGATRYVACRIRLTDAVGITDGGAAKIKAKSCEVLYEVSLDGERVETAAVAS